MRVTLRHHYRGPFVSETGQVRGFLRLSSGENDLTQEEIDFLERQSPGIIIGQSEKEINSHRDKMLRTRVTK